MLVDVTVHIWVGWSLTFNMMKKALTLLLLHCTLLHGFIIDLPEVPYAESIEDWINFFLILIIVLVVFMVLYCLSLVNFYCEENYWWDVPPPHRLV